MGIGSWKGINLAENRRVEFAVMELHAVAGARNGPEDEPNVWCFAEARQR